MAEDTPEEEKTEEPTARRLEKGARMERYRALRNSLLLL